MGTIFILSGVLGFVIIGSLIYMLRSRANKQEKYRLTSIFIFWKEEGYVAFFGFYFWYLIIIGVGLLVTKVELKGIIGFIIEITLITLPMLIISILLKWRNP